MIPVRPCLDQLVIIFELKCKHDSFCQYTSNSQHRKHNTSSILIASLLIYCVSTVCVSVRLSVLQICKSNSSFIFKHTSHVVAGLYHSSVLLSSVRPQFLVNTIETIFCIRFKSKLLITCIAIISRFLSKNGQISLWIPE